MPRTLTRQALEILGLAPLAVGVPVLLAVLASRPAAEGGDAAGAADAAGYAGPAGGEDARYARLVALASDRLAGRTVARLEVLGPGVVAIRLDDGTVLTASGLSVHHARPAGED